MFRKVLFYTFFIALFKLSIAQHSITRTHKNTQFELGIELVSKEKYAAAQKVFQNYLHNDPDQLKAIEAEYYVAHCALQLEQPQTEQLLVNWRDTYESHPKAPYVFYELGSYKYNRGDYKEAIESYERIQFSELDKKDRYEAQFNLGYSYVKIKDFQKAEENFDAIKGVNHDYTYAANYYSGYIKIKHEDYDEAIRDLQVAEQVDLYKSTVPYMIMNVYHRQNKYKELIDYAERVFERKTKIRNENKAYLLIAEAHYGLKNYEKADEYYERYISKTKKPSPNVLYRYGIASWKNQKYSAAINSFKRVIDVNDSLGQYASYYLGDSYLKEGNKDYALLAFQQASSVDYDKSVKMESLFNLAKLQYEQKLFKESIASFDLLRKLDENLKYKSKSSELTAESYLNSEDYNEAISYIERIKSPSQDVQKTYQKVCYHKGVELFNKGKYKAALTYFNKSLENKIDEKYTIRGLFWRGETYSLLTNWDKAWLDYAALFKIPDADKSPYYLRGVYGIGYAYFNRKEYDKALNKFELYTRRLKKSKKQFYYSDALVRLGDCYFYKRDFIAAMKNYKQAVNAKVKSLDYVYYQMGDLSERSKDEDAALKYYNIVINDFDNSVYRARALFAVANLQGANANNVASITAYTELIKQYPKHELIPAALMKRAGQYNAIKSYEKSRDDYDHVIDKYCGSEYGKYAIVNIKDILSKLGEDTYTERIEKYAVCDPDNKDIERLVYNDGYKEYENGNFTKAVSKMQAFIKKYPESKLVGEAKYLMADSYQYDEKYEEAISGFEEWLLLGEKNHYDECVNNLLMLTLESEYYEKAIKYGEEALKLSSSEDEQIIIFTDLIKAYNGNKDYQKSIEYCNEIIDREEKVIGTKHYAQLYKGKGTLGMGDTTAAIKLYSELINTAADEYGCEADYDLAHVYFLKKEYKASIDSTSGLRKRFPSYTNWIGKSFLLAAENYIGLEEDYNAVAVLKSLEKFPDEQIKELAKERLDQIEQEQKSLDSEDEDLDLSQEDIKNGRSIDGKEGTDD